ncbi:Acetoin utilization deacetylase AcuC [Polaribacter sp. Hel1_33_78]|jgi:acetoin utilization deacetylase AcuC-like enzyme|uniref:histone deacetylase family protein n=1 Tax=unclassified Polaribacter TaxID=196858 RepID=UPI00052D01A5|nr:MULTISPECIES: histone deacetylase [unclassified Polaribacter]KGL60007.1 histone deacetylase [Polaribacter sp. Hel1_33_49]MBT3742144.1 histone deacetylase [Polaribacter sp.]MDG1194269.1 histone deacetylase [Polaribacter sp.]MDG1404014.1 histone deacetylase [Polaribacter sp.]MDG2435973.1 histone deacetylase [Polaribacter sp.]
MLKIAFHPIYKHELPVGHRFPMEKYDLLPQQLIYEGTCVEENFFEPKIPNNKHFFTVHDPEYFFDLLNITLSQKAARKIGFPLSEVLVAREMIIADGTIKASEFALKNGIAMNIAGGTHHAFSNRGEAFCMLNDQAIGARYLQQKGLVKKILIVDLDVHQGNGTAEIFKNDTSVFTFSMHGKSNYPFIKETSDLDIALENDTKDNEYLSILKETLPKLINQEKPDFIYYLCGVDVIETDKLGKLGLTIAGCKERDKFVLQTSFDLKIPVMCSMGGGYSKDINIIVNAHANTFRLAQEIYF